MSFNSPHQFDREKLTELMSRHLDKLCSEFEEEYFKDLDLLLQTLFVIGFIGAVKSRKTIYYYQEDPVVISYTSEFVIHPAFRSALQVDTIREIPSDQSSLPGGIGGHGPSTGGRLPGDPTTPPLPPSSMRGGSGETNQGFESSSESG